MKELLKYLFLVLGLGLAADVSAQGVMRWRIRSVETTWTENAFTGEISDKKTRSKLNVVTVKMRRSKKDGKDLILFESGEMKGQTDSQATTGNYIPFDKKGDLVKNLTYASRQMGRIFREDYSTNLCEIGTINFTLTGEEKKQTLIVDFQADEENQSTFELPKPQVDRLLYRLKMMR